MEHTISIKPDFAMLEVVLDPGESLVAESGAMVGMDPHVEMKGTARGGLLKGLRRKVLGGESFFQTTFTGAVKPGRVFLAPGAPGDIEAKELEAGDGLLIQSSCFLACTSDVNLDTSWGGARGFFSGTGLFLLKAKGPGIVWFTSFGGLNQVPVMGDYIVDTGHIVAFDEGLDYGVEAVRGIKSLFLSGEGLVARFKGVGNVWMQTRSSGPFAAFLHPFRPVKKKSND